MKYGRTTVPFAGKMAPPRLYGPRVITDKNIGKDFEKPGRNNRYRPHQGKRECERRARHLATHPGEGA